MNRGEPSSALPGASAVGGVAGVLAGAAAMGIVDALALVTLPRITGRGLLPLATHVLYALGHAFVVGAALAALTATYRLARARFGLAARRPALVLVLVLADAGAIAAAAILLGFVVLSDDVGHLAARIAGGRASLAFLLRVALVVGVALGVPAAAALARMGARGGARWGVLAGGLALAIVNHLVLTTDYPGAHLFLFVTGCVIAGSALASWPLPALAARIPPPARGLALAVMIAWGAWSVASPPSSKLRVEMLAVNGENLEPLVARLQARTKRFGGAGAVPPEMRAWFVDRKDAPPVPPTHPLPRPGDDIVILLTLDSLRADVVESGKYDAELPELARMRSEGVHFTMARSPGSQTIYSLSEMFAGKYFSELYWAHHLTDVWPAKDASLRFPSLLTSAGVGTVTFASQSYLTGEFGVVRGFAEEENLEAAGSERGTPPLAPELVDRAVARLGRQGAGPMFLFVHFMDSHAPYYLSGVDGTSGMIAARASHDRFIRSLAQIDAEVTRLRRTLADKGLDRRTTLIVTADHGEAFGEHGATMHGVNLYEELIRVPLLVVGPHVVARADATPVSLIDIGPTILDLYGLPTPGSYLGQSLLPLLRGEKADLTRPIAAEGRLKQALILPSGLKLIRNQREGTFEIYDLSRDPAEKDDRFEAMGAAGRDRLGILEAFFDAHLLRKPAGYQPPYVR